MKNVTMRRRFLAGPSPTAPEGLSEAQKVVWRVKGGCPTCRPVVVTTRPPTPAEQKQLESKPNPTTPAPS